MQTHSAKMAGGHLWISTLLLVPLISYTVAQNVLVVAPNTFRLGAFETVGVFVTQGLQSVDLYLQDYPGKKTTFSRMKVLENDTDVVQMRVNPEDLPDLALSPLSTKHYVLLVAEGRNFRTETKVLVSLHSGYIFVQSDKPIYTPDQTAHFRIIQLKEDMHIDKGNFTLEIRNPQDIIVEQKPSNKLTEKNGLYSHNFALPPTALEGEWSLVVKYGHKILRNETVVFEVKKYTLPTYKVTIKAPEVVLPTTDNVEVEVEAKYVYGKDVGGTAKCKFSVLSRTMKKISIGSVDGILLRDGKGKCNISRKRFEDRDDVRWFPELNNWRLIVEAEVTERATGQKENATSTKTVFSQTKYLVDFKRTLKYFTPKFVVNVLAVITEASGKAAPNVDARIEIKDQNGNLIKTTNDQHDKSDEEGKISFLILTSSAVRQLHITIVTEDVQLSKEIQGQGRHVMLSSNPTSYVLLDRSSIPRALKVKKEFTSTVYASSGNTAIFYVATTGGRIVGHGSLTAGNVQQRIFRFRVSDLMVPSVRVTLIAVQNGITLTDSVQIDVEKECREKAKISVESSIQSIKPGEPSKVSIQGTSGTVVGILAVDKAVYALRNKGLLTKEKMYSKMEEHDLGCGPGGGIDSQLTLANAGLLILSDKSTIAPERTSCTERKLRKRDLKEDILKEELEDEQLCCFLGMDKPDEKSCEELAEIVRSYHKNDSCADVFLRCCLKYTNSSNDIQGRSDNGIGEEPQFVSEKEERDLEDNTQERKDFPETWLFETCVIGQENRAELSLTVPHSITTWMIQAVGVNPNHGICVADPVEAVVFKNLFIQLKFPYSVVRNEQIEIRATIFNYGETRQAVTVYMYGVEGLCSEAQPNSRGEGKKIYVSGNGGAETVTFPVVPLEIGKFAIKVVALSAQESDKIVKKLNVVAEGIPRVEDIVIDVDPSNVHKINKRHIVNAKYETHTDPENRQQHSSVSLMPEQDFIPGTESCIITAIGDKFGPVVQTVLNSPDKLIRMPGGCGEQTMISFSPTLYTLHYLKSTGKLTPQQETNAYKFVRDGYARELTFRKPDGSYAAWLPRPSSTWLTAFVAKVFCQARRYVFIDENTICTALNWLARQQNHDGSFIDQNPVIHQEMTGGIKGTIPMTAFVTITLYNCQCSQVNLDNTKEKAVKYLTQIQPAIRDPYQLSIVAYALSLADPTKAGLDANKRLLDLSNVNQELNTRHWGQPGTALSVETASFALLTQLIHGNLDIAGSIVNWMNTQRTAQGAFWSTQDTVLALEALAEYAIYARDPDMSLACNLTSSVDLKFKESFEFNPTNSRVLRSYELKKLKGRLHLDAAGTGVSTLSVQLRYNVPKKLEEICKFEIDVNVTKVEEIIKPQNRSVANEGNVNQHFNKSMLNELGFRSQKGNASAVNQPPLALVEVPRPKRNAAAKPKLSNNEFVANISICVKYLSNRNTNMAIVDTGIFTGFTPNKSDLDMLVSGESVPIDNYEETGRSIVFYFNYIPHAKPVCFWFRATREYIVGNLESSTITAFDYYNPEHSCTVFYSPNHHNALIQTLCTGKVCKCAEGGCAPEAPFQDILEEGDSGTRKQLLMDVACDESDYVWKVVVQKIDEDSSSFLTVNVKVVAVLKEGRESKDNFFLEPQRQLLLRKTCTTGHLETGKTYVIMGIDQEPMMKEEGELKYTYYINRQTRIYEWYDSTNRKIKKSKEEKNLQKSFNSLEKDLIRDGCLH